MQSHKHSLMETFVNIGIGMAISQVLTMWVFGVSSGQSFKIVLLYTGVSVVRSYAVRRAFNNFHRREGDLVG